MAAASLDNYALLENRTGAELAPLGHS